MALTNSEFKNIIQEYGDRIFYIQFNNNYRIYVGYEDGQLKSVNDILFKTVGSTDLIGFPVTTKSFDHRAMELSYVSWKLTELIENITVMDEDYKDFRADPLLLT